MQRILNLATQDGLHQVMIDVREIMVDVQLDEVIDFELAAPTEFSHLLTDEEMRTLVGNTGGGTVIIGIHQPAFDGQHGSPLDDMVTHGRLADDTPFRLEHLLGYIG